MRQARGLIIRKPWIDLILDGLKTWEMRSTHTKHRGPTYMIEAGSGLIQGVAMLGGSHAVPNEAFDYYFDKHRVDDLSLLEKWNIAWRFSGARRLQKPVPYQHPRGAVTWVKLPAPFYE